ncbi:STAS-like domain-containing protein [Streptococcus anginosus]|uniref:STAS-like domain-containing protein n=1 Tax=Streptococcus anginosus TaxID=1328 RepID=UPI0039C2FE60
MHTLLVREVIGDTLAVTSDKGEKIFEILKKNIEKGEPTTLDFEGITDLISAFSNTAIGQLYDVADAETLKEFVKVNPNTLHPADRRTIERSIKNSRNKRKQDKEFRQMLADEMDEELGL